MFKTVDVQIKKMGTPISFIELYLMLLFLVNSYNTKIRNLLQFSELNFKHQVVH